MLFEDITILAGSNGSGKSTVLNIIAEKLKLTRVSLFNYTELYEPYLHLTKSEILIDDREVMRSVMEVSRIITSDDVFNHILKVRKKNDDVDFKRDVIREKRCAYRKNPSLRPREIDLDSPESLQAYRDYSDMMANTLSDYVRSRNILNERNYSNGENGYRYFINAIRPGGLYLLDEPENSLSAGLQVELSQYIRGMARFYDCQFIISSHSPFLLSIASAKIYDMDASPVSAVKWQDIPNIRIYYDFFKQHAKEFER
jgi:predicted ATPase